jgi:hypothetical protein
MELYPVSVTLGDGRMDLRLRKGGKAPYTGKGVPEHPAFFRYLSFIGQVLKGTSPAASIEGAKGRPPQGRRFGDFQQFRPCPVLIFFDNSSGYQISRSGKVHKDRFSPVTDYSGPPGNDLFHRGGKNFTHSHGILIIPLLSEH